MLHLALYQPEIPPNTGNLIRLCANSGAALHLIHPLGFDLSTKQVRRAGLDYHELSHVTEHADWEQFEHAMKDRRRFAVTTKGATCYSTARYQDEDVLLMGPETRGLPDSILQATDNKRKIKIPMRAGSRSLNLSNAAAIVLYEAWRQLEFASLMSPTR